MTPSFACASFFYISAFLLISEAKMSMKCSVCIPMGDCVLLEEATEKGDNWGIVGLGRPLEMIRI